MSVVLEQTSISPEKMIEILNIEQCYHAKHGWPYLDALILK